MSRIRPAVAGPGGTRVGSLRIVGGAWRGRRLVAPPGQTTRPTADRVRQALFDMLMHAPWAGRDVMEGASVLDVFAGTGAMGLEALSRGAARAWFLEHDPLALAVLRTNIAACRAEDRAKILAGDVLTVRRPADMEAQAGIVFLDPPYGRDLVPMAVDRLNKSGLIDLGALIVAEISATETWRPQAPLLAERVHGAARMIAWRLASSC